MQIGALILITYDKKQIFEFKKQYLLLFVNEAFH